MDNVRKLQKAKGNKKISTEAREQKKIKYVGVSLIQHVHVLYYTCCCTMLYNIVHFMLKRYSIQHIFHHIYERNRKDLNK